MTFLTIFSAPKPFTNPHIATIQANAIQSWTHLGPEVDVMLIGEEAGLSEAASRYGVRQLSGIVRNREGTPLVSSIFQLVHENSNSSLLAYVNADVLLLSDFIKTARRVSERVKNFLIVGQRWDLDVTVPIDFSGDWESQLRALNDEKGKLYPPMGSDYFIFPRSCFTDTPDFAIGRGGWDNWMIYKARREHWATIDGTPSILDIHQKHDYSHLPDGQPHYRLPETYENIRLAGGRLRTTFTLMDVNFHFVEGRLTGKIWSGKKLMREIEILPLVSWKIELLAEPFFYIAHPKKAWRRFTEAVKRRLHQTGIKRKE